MVAVSADPSGLRRRAWCGLLAPVLQFGLAVSLGFFQPGYSYVHNYLSELGARGAPFAPVMNWVGFVFVGILLLVFSEALYQAHGPGSLAVLGTTLLGWGGLCLVALGLFPCDPGCSMRTPSPLLTLLVELRSLGYPQKVFQLTMALWVGTSALQILQDTK